MTDGDRGQATRRRRRRWRFGTVVFDEIGWTVLIDGVPATIESKPLELLHELCLHAGETVSKDELLDTVWSGITVVENSIPTAVAKLRRALGPGNADAIATVQGVGYRLATPVTVETSPTVRVPRFAFTPGDPVPGRPQWHLVALLGDGGAGDTWRSRHAKTGETRIFKFADGPDQLRVLKREASIARLLMAALGNDGPFAPLLEWNFDAPPYFVESRDCGLSLTDWAQAAGGLQAVSLQQRVAIAALTARAQAAVHDVGVLHKDLKPANILIESVGAEPRIRLVDFGSGLVIDHAAFRAHAITPSMDDEDAEGRQSGTPFYRAPELAADGVPTAKSDIYALGVLLFQLVVGDFTRSLAPGWEGDVSDPLLRADIAAAAAGDPAARMEGAAVLAERLESLPARRAEAAARTAAAARLDELARQDARRRARRPWVAAAGIALASCVIATSLGAFVAVRQRDEARRQQQIATASYRFLADDLLGRVNPYHSGAADETIAAAAARASGEIDRRFAGAPAVAGSLHHSLARAFDQRTDLAAARAEYAKAERAMVRAGQTGMRERRILLSQWAQLEALSGDATRLPEARRLLARAQGPGPPDPELAVWLDSAAGSVALAGEDVRTAQTAFTRAALAADALPAAFDARQRLNLNQRVAFVQLRLGNGPEAERRLRPLLAGFARLEGPLHPNTLNIRLNLVQALLVQKRYPQVVAAATALLPVMERALGTDHRRTLQVLAVRQQALGGLERYAEAARDGERVWRTTAAREGPKTFQALAGRGDTAESECRAGRHAAGLADATAALAGTRAGEGPETALAMALRATVASCLIGSGRAAEAMPLLRGIDRTKVAELVGDPKWGANLDLALAQVCALTGRADEARTRLAAATTLLGSDADAHQKRLIQRTAAMLVAAAR